jgi:O-antigen ligase
MSMTRRLQSAFPVAVIGAAILSIAPLVALLAASGLGVFAVGLLVAGPLMLLLHRSPVAVIPIWIFITPFVVEGNGGAERLAFTAVHRGLPLAGLIFIVLSGWLGLSHRRRVKFNIIDWLTIAYVAATVVSVLAQSVTPAASLVHVYDRVGAPVLLYFIIRLAGPTAAQLERWLPVIAAALAIQCVIGALAWVAPGLLPGPWLGRAGQRTIGSLGHPNVYGVTVLTFGLILLHGAASSTRIGNWQRFAYYASFVVAMAAAFFTFGRANWLAAIAVAALSMLLYPRKVSLLALAGIAVVALLFMSGQLDEQVQTAQDRFLSDQSEESALSRLPVVLASVRMYQEKPLFGWGYGNFDRFDRQFQRSVGGLALAEKDHASHNLYLTIAAEQGSIGLIFYLGPAAFAAFFAARNLRLFERGGFVSARLVFVLLGCLAVHVIVNNLANMRIVYGLGLWWICVALVVHLIDFARHADANSHSLVDIRDIDPYHLPPATTAGRS